MRPNACAVGNKCERASVYFSARSAAFSCRPPSQREGGRKRRPTHGASRRAAARAANDPTPAMRRKSELVER